MSTAAATTDRRQGQSALSLLNTLQALRTHVASDMPIQQGQILIIVDMYPGITSKSICDSLNSTRGIEPKY